MGGSRVARCWARIGNSRLGVSGSDCPIVPRTGGSRQQRQVKLSVIEFPELAAVGTAEAFDMAVARGRAGQEDEVRNLPFMHCRGARVALTVSAGGARTLVPGPPDRGQPSPGR